MTGWRCGFVAGNERLVRAYADLKDHTDSGQFLAIQHAAAYGFDHREITEKIAAKYSRRMTGLVEVLKLSGFAAAKPKGSFFLYVTAPKAAAGKGWRRTLTPRRTFPSGSSPRSSYRPFRGMTPEPAFDSASPLPPKTPPGNSACCPKSAPASATWPLNSNLARRS